MINILSEAANKIREYLDDPAHRDAYVGATRKEIEALLAEMERIRRKLDTPPPRMMLNLIQSLLIAGRYRCGYFNIVALSAVNVRPPFEPCSSQY
jgi:hypothetical protein